MKLGLNLILDWFYNFGAIVVSFSDFLSIEAEPGNNNEASYMGVVHF